MVLLLLLVVGVDVIIVAVLKAHVLVYVFSFVLVQCKGLYIHIRLQMLMNRIRWRVGLVQILLDGTTCDSKDKVRSGLENVWRAGLDWVGLDND